jgi:putative Mg2+ transporter-C (MgtC) family protein
MPLLWVDIAKLCLAALLGGLIGLERESKHRPAGLRTYLFISLGAAMFTMLSDQLAAAYTGDHTRIAAQIIPGIGFIGAGSILHSRRDLVTGITTAAGIFVVASVGMAVGGGRYLLAVFGTALILGVLSLLGIIERALNIKMIIRAYEVAGRSADEVTHRLNGLLEPLHLLLENVRVAPTPEHVRVHFECEGTRKTHGIVIKTLLESSAFESVTPLGPVQSE